MSSALISSADASRITIPAEDEDVAALRESVIHKLTYAVGRDPIVATDWDWFMAAALAVRDHVLERWLASTRTNYISQGKRVYYLSLEFLIGRLLHDSLNNLGLVDRMRAALAELGVDYDRLRNVEHDAALGNGGLGRLAACFMESMATLGIAAHGYGIRYNHGMFRQVINDGWQQEYPENWLTFGNPWEIARPDATHLVGFGGTVETQTMADGNMRYVWHPAETVDAVAYDTPVVGWRGHYANTLRLWSARAADPLGLDAFNRGDHAGALAPRVRANAISQVLYPSDETPAGQELRLRQEFFFTSASLQDLVGRHMRQHNGDIRLLPDKAAIQLNDTHPAIAVAELMRILLDLHELSWDEAWRITNATISYTNHTLLPEALESWPVSLMERLLPRHMQIVYQINRLHLDAVCASPRPDAPPLAAVSLIDDNAGRRVRMGSLAFLGAHKVNGVSALHTELMRQTVFHDLHQLYPDRIVNKTNGITFRRWLFAANPRLTGLLTEVVGERVLDDADALADFAKVADDTAVHERLRQHPPRQQAGAGEAGGRSDGHPVGSRCAVRRAHQAHPRVQAAVAQYPGDDRAVQRHARAADLELGAAGEDLRRQGGRQLSPRQADHQADQRRGARDQQRPGAARAAEGGLHSRLQRQPGGGDHSGRRCVGADLHRRVGGVRHRQHEAGAERRADDRHAGRRQYRDPASASATTTSSYSA